MSSQRIVVFDDNLALLDMTELLLALEGYEPRGCLSAAGAVEVVHELQPAVVIVELHLERNEAGMELVNALRYNAATARIPIVVWSADPRVGSIVAAHQLSQLNRVVVREKPVLAMELLALVARLAHAT